MSKSGQLNLWQYFAIEGIASFACTIFQQGIYFWAATRHAFTATESLLLGATQGLGYTAASLIGGRIAGRFGYDRALQFTMIGTAAITLSLWRWGWHGAPFLLMGVFISLTGPFWPSTEANVMHARSTIHAPRRIGIYNITWATLGALGFFACGFLVKRNIDSIIWLPGVIMGLLVLFYAGRKRAHGDAHAPTLAPAANASLDRLTRRRFMHLHWLCNSLAYFAMMGFVALLPHIGERLGLSQSGVIWLTCSFQFSRAAAFVVLMLWEGWHYRASWSIAGLYASPVCIAIMLFSAAPAVVLAACILFGFVLGLAYFGSLYYSLNYGENKGEHGGLHEAILGSGILFGPLAGAGGAAIGGASGASWVIVIAATVLSAIGLVVVNRINRA